MITDQITVFLYQLNKLELVEQDKRRKLFSLEKIHPFN